MEEEEESLGCTHVSELSEQGGRVADGSILFSRGKQKATYSIMLCDLGYDFVAPGDTSAEKACTGG